VTRITSTLHKGFSTIVIISRSDLLRTRNVSDSVWRKSKQMFLFYDFFSRKSYRPLERVEIFGIGSQVTDENITGRMCFACWITRLGTRS